jgi:hypothetical protein
MTREAMLNRDALSPQFIKYNPCYYCKKTTTCRMECLPRVGFDSILEDHLTHFYKDDADEKAITQMKDNAIKYGFTDGKKKGKGKS